MKKLLILATILLMFTLANAQKFYTVNYESRADVKVFVVYYESQAGRRNLS